VKKLDTANALIGKYVKDALSIDWMVQAEVLDKLPG
jgi:hypothetical protein